MIERRRKKLEEERMWEITQEAKARALAEQRKKLLEQKNVVKKKIFGGEGRRDNRTLEDLGPLR